MFNADIQSTESNQGSALVVSFFIRSCSHFHEIILANTHYCRTLDQTQRGYIKDLKKVEKNGSETQHQTASLKEELGRANGVITTLKEKIRDMKEGEQLLNNKVESLADKVDVLKAEIAKLKEETISLYETHHSVIPLHLPQRSVLIYQQKLLHLHL